MNIKRAHWSALDKSAGERVLYRIASRAVGDTVFGGCSALVIAERAARMRLPSGRDMLAAVSDVYAPSSGRVPDHLSAWECDECGSIHADAESASACCGEADYE